MTGAALQLNPPEPEVPAILLQARERTLSRLLVAYAITGLLFMLLPGTFLGVWNLISISKLHALTSAAWIQAHGHAQIFGWIGTFIIGIGFYSIPRVTGNTRFALWRGWATWILWTLGVTMRWYANVSAWHWRVLLPLSAAFELTAFLIFYTSIRRHRIQPAPQHRPPTPVWVLLVLASTVGFFLALVLNLIVAVLTAMKAPDPAFSPVFEQRLLVLSTWGFLVLAVWGFNARWLPTFLGLPPPRREWLMRALYLDTIAILSGMAGWWSLTMTLLLLAASAAAYGLRVFESAERPAKTTGVHSSFPLFVRLCYAWLILAAVLQIVALWADHAHGFVGASRHALTVGFLACMVFAMGQRVLPAFTGMKILFSPKLMFACLALLNFGCAIRVIAEVLAYEGFSQRAWSALPVSALAEMAAVVLFAANLVFTFLSVAPHKKLITIAS